MKKLFTVLAVVALAIAPCTWDSNDPSEASWLAAAITTHFTHLAPAAKVGPLCIDFPGDDSAVSAAADPNLQIRSAARS